MNDSLRDQKVVSALFDQSQEVPLHVRQVRGIMILEYLNIKCL